MSNNKASAVSKANMSRERHDKKQEALMAGGNAGPKKKTKNLWGSFFNEEVEENSIVNDKAVMDKHRKLVHLLLVQGAAVFILVAVVVFGAPVMKPFYIYKYKTLGAKAMEGDLVPLSVPNMTNKAILSWAATSITEVMTVGFGDFDTKMEQQRGRFTANGWNGFVKAMRDMNVRQDFKATQLILTTVPSDTPVISAQGEDMKRNVYYWIVQMPIVMTYATNNNVTSRMKSFVQLTIIRVPSRDNIGGIAIEQWQDG